MRSPFAALTLAISALAGMPAGALAADGLATPSTDAVWPRWQARVALPAPLLPTLLAASPALAKAPGTLPAGALLGDYYFDTARFGLARQFAGMRATGGLVFGGRGLTGAQAMADTASDTTAPYLGLGYSGQSAKSGWGITADVGLLAEPGQGRGDRILLGVQGQERALRELRLSPLLQVGVRYAF